jgi:hypothetical protein
VAVDAEVEFEHEPPIRLTVRDTSGRDGRIEWNLQALLEDERDELRARADAADDLTEVVAAVNGRRYFFTRLLILALEPEQLRELVEALLIVPAGGRGHALAMPAPRSLGVLHRGHLRDEIGKRFKKVPRKDGLPVAVLADSMPFGLCDGILVLRQRTLVDQGATKEAFARFDARFRALVGLRDYPKQLNDDLSALGAGGSADEVFVPTGGHFLEAILGRSNSAERLDGRRHIFWHELPNPLLAPEIAGVVLGSRAQPLPDVAPTVPAPGLTPAGPTPLPDPALASAVMQVLGSSNLFRDMSKTAELANVLGNLSTLAGNMSTQAGQLVGNAQQQALSQAGALGQKVADLTAQLFAQSQGGALPSGATATQRAVAGNRIEDLARAPAGQIAPTEANRAVASAFGAPLGRAPSAGQSGYLVPKDSPPPKYDGQDARMLHNQLHESLRATTDTGAELERVAAAGDGEAVADAVRRLVAERKTMELQPLLEEAKVSDKAFDRAVRLTLDLDASLQQVGEVGLPTLEWAEERLAGAWLASRERAIKAIGKEGDLHQLGRIEVLLSIAQHLEPIARRLPPSMAGVGILDGAGVAVEITSLESPSADVAHRGDAVQIGLAAQLVIGDKKRPLAGARVSFFAAGTLEETVNGTADDDGKFAAEMHHRPPTDGIEGVSLGDGAADLVVMSHVTARESVLLTATRGLTIPAQLEVEVAEAMYDDDGSNALVGDVVMARRRPVRITFEVRSAGMLLGSTPVDVGLTGGGTIVERGVLTGSGLSAGRVSVLYRPPAADGVAYVAAVVRTRSGRPAAGSAIVDHNA